MKYKAIFAAAVLATSNAYGQGECYNFETLVNGVCAPAGIVYMETEIVNRDRRFARILAQKKNIKDCAYFDEHKILTHFKVRERWHKFEGKGLWVVTWGAYCDTWVDQ